MNKELERILNNIRKTGDNSNDKDIKAAADNLANAIKAKYEREQSQNGKGDFEKELSRIKNDETKNIVKLAHKFINGGKKRDIILLVGDNGLDSCFWDGEDEYTTDMILHAMCVDKRLAAIMMSAVFTYVSNFCKVEIKPYGK